MNDEGLPWSNLKGLPHLYHSFTTKGLPQTGLPQKGLSRKMFTTKKTSKKVYRNVYNFVFVRFAILLGQVYHIGLPQGLPHLLSPCPAKPFTTLPWLLFLAVVMGDMQLRGLPQ